MDMLEPVTLNLFQPKVYFIQPCEPILAICLWHHGSTRSSAYGETGCEAELEAKLPDHGFASSAKHETQCRIKKICALWAANLPKSGALRAAKGTAFRANSLKGPRVRMPLGRRQENQRLRWRCGQSGANLSPRAIPCFFPA